MRSARGMSAGIVALLVSGVMAASVVAQDPVDCDLVPLELPLFGGTPVAMFATPEPTATPAPGSLADDEAVRVLQQYAACTNTGDPTLVWAMFTPRWFSQAFADSREHYLPAFEQMLDREGQPTGVPLEFVEIVSIVEQDGAVDVTATFRSGELTWTDKLTLVQIDGHWLIDEVQPVDPPADGA